LFQAESFVQGKAGARLSAAPALFLLMPPDKLSRLSVTITLIRFTSLRGGGDNFDTLHQSIFGEILEGCLLPSDI
jgi:hypothetical protein